MRYSQRIRLLMTNFEQHETRLFELQHAMKIEHNALALALLKREYDEQMYLAQRYARMIVEVEEQRIRRLVERKN